jgi:hypothetical protein
MPNVVEIVLRAIDQITGPMTKPIKSLADFGSAAAAASKVAMAAGTTAAASFELLMKHTQEFADEAGKMACRAWLTWPRSSPASCPRASSPSPKT